ncbi:MAG: glycosyltransferase, partial [Planctomycetota bacterium]
MPEHVAIICGMLEPRDPVTKPTIELAHALSSDGYRVSLLAPGYVEAEVGEGVQLLTSQSASRIVFMGILKYRCWVAKTLSELDPDRTISMRSRLAADIIIPMRGLLQARVANSLRQADGLAARLLKRLSCLLPSMVLSRRFERRALMSESLRSVVALSPSIRDSVDMAGLRPDVKVIEAHLPLEIRQANPTEADATRAKLARAWGLASDAYWITLPFSRESRHGLEPMLRAFKPFVDQASDAVLLLAGPTRYTHLAWIAELGLRDRVRFVGSTERLDDLLACSDLVVCPTDYDPVGWDVRPALASGKPTITTTASDLAGVVEQRGGTFLPSPPGPQALLD